MPARHVLPLALLLLLLIGCTPTPVVIPTAAALPTLTPPPPVTATETESPPPTWTPSPPPTPVCSEVIRLNTVAANAACAETATGEACFVAPRVMLAARAGQTAPVFAAPGDRAPLAVLARVETLPFDAVTNTWGLARLRITADPPDVAAGQWIMAVPFGEAVVMETETGTGPFQAMHIHTGPADAGCAAAPVPGVLLQNTTGSPAQVTVNGLGLRFTGTLLVRAQHADTMTVIVLEGDLTALQAGAEPLSAATGTEVRVTLGGDDGFTPQEAATLHPRAGAAADGLPLPALPQTVAVGPPVIPTRATTETDILAAPPGHSPTPSPTDAAPFSGTPPAGAQTTFSGQRITPGQLVSGTVPDGGSSAWVFVPVGVGPGSFDQFEVTAFGGWDPVLSIESAVWGMYREDVNPSDSSIEFFAASLAGDDGGDWRILIEDADGGGGGYTLRYACQGAACPE